MQKRILLLVLLLINSFLIANAQEERDTGTLYYNNSKETSIIYFTKELNQFMNKYVIYKTKTDIEALCSVILEYDKSSGKINVSIKDMMQDVHRIIKFDENATACIVKNYKVNDTLININDKCEILFTFQDISKKEKIILNQISSSDNSVTYILTPLRNSYLNSHLNASKSYWDIYRINRRSIADIYKSVNMPITEETYNDLLKNVNHVLNSDEISGIRAKISGNNNFAIETINKRKIEKLITESDLADWMIIELMNKTKNIDYFLTDQDIAKFRDKYKRIIKIDSLKSVIRKDWQATLNLQKGKEKPDLSKPILAEDISNAKLKKTLDSLFFEQCKDFHKAIGSIIINFTIYTDSLGKVYKIEKNKDISYVYGNYEMLFSKPYIVNCDSTIKMLKLKPKVGIVSQTDNYLKLYNKYYSDCHRLDSSMAPFIKLFDSIKKDLNPSAKKDLYFPTIYKYQFKYTSNSNIEKWKITLKDNKYCYYKSFSNDSTLSSHYKVVDENKKDLFNKKYPKPELGIYNVPFFNAKLGLNSLYEMSDSVHRKYRFYSHIGLSLVIFIDNQQPQTQYINNKIYDAYFTCHRLGLFGGYGKIKNSNSLYYEGGAYISPTTNLYFKLGASKLSTSSSTGCLFGLSLILPVVQFELGYNSTLKLPYFNFGLNFPIFH